MSSSDPPTSSGRPTAPLTTKRSSARWIYALGVVLILLGVGLIVPAVLDRGICMFVPCDPAAGRLGFTPLDDGTVGIELGDTTAAQVQLIEVVAGVRPDNYDSEVLWRVERSGTASGEVERPIVPGVVPGGFVESVSLDEPLPSSFSVTVTNGCDGTPVELPDAPLEPGVVTRWSGATESIESFRADDLGLSDCEPDLAPGTRRRAMAGLVCGFIGALVVLLGGRVDAGQPVSRSRRSARP